MIYQFSSCLNVTETGHMPQSWIRCRSWFACCQCNRQLSVWCTLQL